MPFLFKIPARAKKALAFFGEVESDLRTLFDALKCSLTMAETVIAPFPDAFYRESIVSIVFTTSNSRGVHSSIRLSSYSKTRDALS